MLPQSLLLLYFTTNELLFVTNDCDVVCCSFSQSMTMDRRDGMLSSTRLKGGDRRYTTNRRWEKRMCVVKYYDNSRKKNERRSKRKKRRACGYLYEEGIVPIRKSRRKRKRVRREVSKNGPSLDSKTFVSLVPLVDTA